jgi:hypothetical protein
MADADRIPCYYIATASALPELNGKAGRMFLQGKEDEASEFYEYLETNVKWGACNYFTNAFTDRNRSSWDKT